MCIAGAAAESPGAGARSGVRPQQPEVFHANFRVCSDMLGSCDANAAM